MADDVKGNWISERMDLLLAKTGSVSNTEAKIRHGLGVLMHALTSAEYEAYLAEVDRWVAAHAEIDSQCEIAEATRLISNLMSIIHRPRWDQTSDVICIKNDAYRWLAKHSND